MRHDRPWRRPGPRPLIMGILNVTPDSFSDGGRHDSVDRAVAHAERMLADGADIIDVGGESTRPGAAVVSFDEEARRTLPVIQRLRDITDVPISIDTSKPQLMREAVFAGATLVNDVNALRAEGAVNAVADLDADVCLMHRQGSAATMQDNPSYTDVVAEVLATLHARADVCRAAGIERGRLLLDPGFGFGKTTTHNLQLLSGLGQFAAAGYPVLVGLSRKSLLGDITGRSVDKRLAGSVSLATVAAIGGARVVRVHDVAETLDAMKIVAALQSV
ncbi:MAG: dihydropteroate synthase [Pseudomonadota bacterium]